MNHAISKPASRTRISNLASGPDRWHDQPTTAEIYELIAPLHGTTDLIVLPETFTSGFSNEAIGNAETMDGSDHRGSLNRHQLDAAVTGSDALRTQRGTCSTHAVRPWTAISAHDSATCSRSRKGNERQRHGHERGWPNGRTGTSLLRVCYDLRFPVFSRNRLISNARAPDYDLALYVANWPSAQLSVENLLRAPSRNLCMVGVNRVGTDGNGLHYSGDSAAIGFLGHPLSEAADEKWCRPCCCRPRRSSGTAFPGAAGRGPFQPLITAVPRLGISGIPAVQADIRETAA